MAEAPSSTPRVVVRPVVTGVPIFVPGHPVSAGALTRVAQLAAGQIPGVAGPRLLAPAERAEIDPVIRPMTVLGEDADFILATEAVGAEVVSRGLEGANTVRVAKPHLLRKTPWHGTARAGLTLSWTAVNERTSMDAQGRYEKQKIVPAYEVGDVIYASKAVKGGVEITPTGGEPTKTDWIDLNLDGRAWATA